MANKTPNLYDRLLDQKRTLKLESDVEDAWATFCGNCRTRVLGDGCAWVLKESKGDPDCPDIEDRWYCGQCVSVDETRRFKGLGPPKMETL